MLKKSLGEQISFFYESSQEGKKLFHQQKSYTKDCSFSSYLSHDIEGTWCKWQSFPFHSFLYFSFFKVVISTGGTFLGLLA